MNKISKDIIPPEYYMINCLFTLNIETDIRPIQIFYDYMNPEQRDDSNYFKDDGTLIDGYEEFVKECICINLLITLLNKNINGFNIFCNYLSSEKIFKIKRNNYLLNIFLNSKNLNLNRIQTNINRIFDKMEKIENIFNIPKFKFNKILNFILRQPHNFNRFLNINSNIQKLYPCSDKLYIKITTYFMKLINIKTDINIDIDNHDKKYEYHINEVKNNILINHLAINLNCNVDNLINVFNESDYLNKSKKFFRDNNIFDINIIPNLNYFLLIFLNLLYFKKSNSNNDISIKYSNTTDKNILRKIFFDKLKIKVIKKNIYNTELLFFEDIEDWIKNQKVDEELENNKNLIRFLKLLTFILNIDLKYLNPDIDYNIIKINRNKYSPIKKIFSNNQNLIDMYINYRTKIVYNNKSTFQPILIGGGKKIIDQKSIINILNNSKGKFKKDIIKMISLKNKIECNLAKNDIAYTVFDF